MVVECDAVVARAQEAILNLHPAAAHQVDAVGPRFGGKTLDVVPIDETSNYRSSVMRNKSVYKRLYGNEEMVSSSESKLPSD